MVEEYISKTLIGVGKVHGGLFLHKVLPDKKKQVHTIKTIDLWHGCLGHSSREVLSLLAKGLDIKDSLENKKKEPCDVCLRAKHTRWRPSQSESNASDLFELIHCDIWGACHESSSCDAH